jgi:phage terminase large subunit-like protein
MNPNQLKHVRILEDSIENKTTGTVIRIVAPNYRTAAGNNASLTIFDELWAYELDAARKFWDELTLSPARKQPLAVVVTYAGYDEESLLYELYKKGLSGQDKKMFFFWSHKNLASWVTKDYLETQRARLKANTYLRLHENRWTSSEEAFIEMEQWDKCIDDNHSPLLPDRTLEIVVGVDVSTKGDSTAVVACTRMENKVILVCHRKWQPSKNAPLDLEETVERHILDLAQNYHIKEVLYDDYQFQRSAMTLIKRGINMVEFPQTLDRLTEMSQNLYDLIKGRNIVLYSDEEFRAHAQKAQAKETQRGWRIIKRSASDKIDLIIALAMAALGAIKIHPDSELRIRELDNEEDIWDWTMD